MFLILILLVGAQRLFELKISKRNESGIRSKGGREYPSRHFVLMKLLHALWLPASFLEAILLKRPFIPGLAGISTIVFLIGQSLRYAAIHALGSRWTVNIMVVPGEQPVEKGIYRYIRHPNYLGVILEIAALPLFHTAYLTAMVFSFMNALILQTRIKSEEKALQENSPYKRVFKKRPRFIPRLSRDISRSEGAN
jgi:methyltransferase